MAEEGEKTPLKKGTVAAARKRRRQQKRKRIGSCTCLSLAGASFSASSYPSTCGEQRAAQHGWQVVEEKRTRTHARAFFSSSSSFHFLGFCETEREQVFSLFSVVAEERGFTLSLELSNSLCSTTLFCCNERRRRAKSTRQLRWRPPRRLPAERRPSIRGQWAAAARKQLRLCSSSSSSSPSTTLLFCYWPPFLLRSGFFALAASRCGRHVPRGLAPE